MGDEAPVAARMFSAISEPESYYGGSDDEGPRPPDHMEATYPHPASAAPNKVPPNRVRWSSIPRVNNIGKEFVMAAKIAALEQKVRSLGGEGQSSVSAKPLSTENTGISPAVETGREGPLPPQGSVTPSNIANVVVDDNMKQTLSQLQADVATLVSGLGSPLAPPENELRESSKSQRATSATSRDTRTLPPPHEANQHNESHGSIDIRNFYSKTAKDDDVGSLGSVESSVKISADMTRILAELRAEREKTSSLQRKNMELSTEFERMQGMFSNVVREAEEHYANSERWKLEAARQSGGNLPALAVELEQQSTTVRILRTENAKLANQLQKEIDLKNCAESELKKVRSEYNVLHTTLASKDKQVRKIVVSIKKERATHEDTKEELAQLRRKSLDLHKAFDATSLRLKNSEKDKAVLLSQWNEMKAQFDETMLTIKHSYQSADKYRLAVARTKLEKLADSMHTAGKAKQKGAMPTSKGNDAVQGLLLRLDQEKKKSHGTESQMQLLQEDNQRLQAVVDDLSEKIDELVLECANEKRRSKALLGRLENVVAHRGTASLSPLAKIDEKDISSDHIAKLESDIAKKDEELVDLREQVRSGISALKIAEETIDHQRNATNDSSLRAELEAMASKLSVLHQVREVMEQSSAELEETVSSLKRENAKLLEEKTFAAETIASLKEKNRSLVDEKTSLEEEIFKLSSKVTDKESAVMDCSLESDQLESRVKRITTELERMTAANSQLKKEIEEHHRAMESIENEVSTLREANASLQSDSIFNLAQLKSARLEVEGLQSQIDDILNEGGSSGSNVEGKKYSEGAEVEGLKAELVQEQERASLLEADIDDLESQISVLQKERAVLQESLKESHHTLEKNNNADDVTRALRERLEEETERANLLEADVEELENKVRSLTNELKSPALRDSLPENNRITSLNVNVDDDVGKELHLEEMTAKVHILEASLEKEEARSREKDSLIKHLQSEEDRLGAELSTALRELDGLRIIMDKKSAMTQQACDKANRLSQEMAKLHEKVEISERSNDEKHIRRKSMSDMEFRLKTAEAALVSSREMIRDFEKRYMDAQEKINALEEDRQTTSDVKKDSINDVKVIEEADELRSQLEMQAETLEEMTVTLSDHEDNIDSLKKQLRDSQTECDKLKEVLAQKESALREADTRCLEAMGECEELSTALLESEAAKDSIAEEILELKHQPVATRVSSVDLLDSKMIEASHKLELANERIRELEDELSERMKSNVENLAEVAEMKDSVAALQALSSEERGDLTSKLRDCEDERLEARSELALLKEEVTVLKGALEAEKRACHLLRVELAQSGGSSNERVTELEDSLEGARLQLESMAKELKDANEELEITKENLKQELEEREAVLERLRSTEEKVAVVLASTKCDSNDSSHASGAEDEIAEAGARQSYSEQSLINQVASLQERVNELGKDLQDSQAAKITCEKECANKEASTVVLKDTMTRLVEENKMLKSEILTFERKAAALHDELVKMEEALALAHSQIADNEAKRRKAAAELLELKGSLSPSKENGSAGIVESYDCDGELHFAAVKGAGELHPIIESPEPNALHEAEGQGDRGEVTTAFLSQLPSSGIRIGKNRPSFSRESFGSLALSEIDDLDGEVISPSGKRGEHAQTTGQMASTIDMVPSSPLTSCTVSEDEGDPNYSVGSVASLGGESDGIAEAAASSHQFREDSWSMHKMFKREIRRTNTSDEL